MKIIKQFKLFKVKANSDYIVPIHSVLGECRLRLFLHGVSNNTKCSIKVNDETIFNKNISGANYSIDIPIKVTYGSTVLVRLNEDRVIDLIIFNLM